jgi:hypothetical protein
VAGRKMTEEQKHERKMRILRTVLVEIVNRKFRNASPDYMRGFEEGARFLNIFSEESYGLIKYIENARTDK